MDTLFFYLSKFAWALLSPGNLLIFLFVFGILLLVFNRQKLAKIILIPAALLAFLVLSFPIGDYLIQPLENRFSPPKTLPDDIDGIILLGGGEDLQRSLSWQVAELGLAGDRYIATKKLADLYPNARVIFTGGSGSVFLQDFDRESHIAEQILADLGLDLSRLELESNSRNTYENFKNIKPITRSGSSYLLVTSAFHMPRSVGIARQFEIDVIAYPVDFRSNSSEFRRVNFDLFDHLKSLEPAVSEWLGLLAYYLSGKTAEFFPAEK